MIKLPDIIDPTKNYSLFLLYEIEQRLKGNTDFFSYCVIGAINKNDTALTIINTLKDHIADSQCICNMIDLLGVELVEKISNF